MGTIRSREKITKPCETCGSPVTRTRSGFKAHTYCSHSCYTSSKAHAESTRATNAKRHPNGLAEVRCVQCGTAFTRPASRVADRKRLFCSRECQHGFLRAQGVEQVTPHGYIKVYVGFDHPGATKTGHIMQHRKVMQEMIGRPLIDAENVHHINGVRSDNRPENLELWSSSQPSGQRVQEKVQWAREMLALYGDLFPEME